MAIKPTTRALDAALDALDTLGFEEWDTLTFLMVVPINPREVYSQFCIKEDEELGFDPTWLVNMLDEMGDLTPAIPTSVDEDTVDFFFADFSNNGVIFILCGWESEILVELMEALHDMGPLDSRNDESDDDDEEDEEDDGPEKKGEISDVGLGAPEPIPLPSS